MLEVAPAYPFDADAADVLGRCAVEEEAESARMQAPRADCGLL
ncbi:hypothetical protein [Streptomyces chartreusis]